MFDLDESIVAWRSGLLGQGGHALEQLDAMEHRLREAVDRLRMRGLSDEQAFDAAVAGQSQAQGLMLQYASDRPAVHWTVCLVWMATGVLGYQLLLNLANIVGLITEYAGFHGGIRGYRLGGLVAGMNYLTLVVGLAGLAYWCISKRRSGRPLSTLAWVVIALMVAVVIVIVVGINTVAPMFLLRAMPPSEHGQVALARAYMSIAWQIGLPVLLVIGIAWLSRVSGVSDGQEEPGPAGRR